jgi:LysM repeat protein
MDLSGLDFDLRGNAPGGLDTSSAARQATTAAPPRPDRNGLITYPTYQVAVARRGDTVADLADRVGANPTEVARFNGRSIGDPLRAGEVIAMPRRVAPPSAAVDTTERPDIGAIAGAAIERSTIPAEGTVRSIDVQTGQEPIRHRAARGETAFSIARLYGVTVKSLAEWNGLSSDLEVREGQYLIIPLIIEEASAGGTPVPPSASSSLPPPVVAGTLPQSPALDNTRLASAQPAPTPARTAPPPGRFAKPVPGTVGAYSSAKQGIDIAASSGTAVNAAADGEVILITRDTDQNPVIVVAHSGDLKSVYANIAGLTVEKGDTVRAGQRIAQVGAASSGLRFSILKGFEPVDPTPLLQ